MLNPFDLYPGQDVNQAFFAAAIPLITSGISALSGLFGGRKQTANNQQTNNSTSTSTPNLTPFQNMIQTILGQKAVDNLDKDTDLSGYAASGLREINSGAEIAKKVAANNVAARGLSYSPAGFNPLQVIDSNRVAEGTDLINRLPLLQKQLNQQDLATLANIFQVMPKASTQTTNQTGTSLVENPGNMAGGALSGAAQGLMAPSSPGGVSNIQAILDAFRKKPSINM